MATPAPGSGFSGYQVVALLALIVGAALPVVWLLSRQPCAHSGGDGWAEDRKGGRGDRLWSESSRLLAGSLPPYRSFGRDQVAFLLI
jgi:hypothetical protein